MKIDDVPSHWLTQYMENDLKASQTEGIDQLSHKENMACMRQITGLPHRTIVAEAINRIGLKVS